MLKKFILEIQIANCLPEKCLNFFNSFEKPLKKNPRNLHEPCHVNGRARIPWTYRTYREVGHYSIIHCIYTFSHGGTDDELTLKMKAQMRKIQGMCVKSCI